MRPRHSSLSLIVCLPFMPLRRLIDPPGYTPMAPASLGMFSEPCPQVVIVSCHLTLWCGTAKIVAFCIFHSFSARRTVTDLFSHPAPLLFFIAYSLFLLFPPRQHCLIFLPFPSSSFFFSRLNRLAGCFVIFLSD